MTPEQALERNRLCGLIDDFQQYQSALMATGYLRDSSVVVAWAEAEQEAWEKLQQLETA